MRQQSRDHIGLDVTLTLLTAFMGSTALAQPPDAVIESIVSSAQFREAVDFLEADHDRFVEDLIDLTEIPAPPFMEDERAEATAVPKIASVEILNVRLAVESRRRRPFVDVKLSRRTPQGLRRNV